MRASLRAVRATMSTAAPGAADLPGELRELATRCDPQLREAIDRGDHIATAATKIYAKAPLLMTWGGPIKLSPGKFSHPQMV